MGEGAVSTVLNIDGPNPIVLLASSSARLGNYRLSSHSMHLMTLAKAIGLPT